jgi:peptidoglycan/LPS O-acetylase OafA/YrhL
MSSVSYRPDIDALRGLAVLMVVLYHGEMVFPGGYVGVDVFFVISGFLITNGIARDLARGEFSLLGFWDRRIRRIQPALCVMVALTLLVGWAVMLPGDVEDLANSAYAQTAMIANVFFWRAGGYFEAPADGKPLLHTWSLAVEEQFYVLFPLLLAAMQKRFLPQRYSILLMLCVTSFAVSVYGAFNHPSATYFLLPTRAWELGMGALLSLSTNVRMLSPTPRTRELTAVAGLSLILGSGLLFNEKTVFPGTSALLPCVGASLFIVANGNGMSKAGKFLSAKPLLFVGLVSYSFYLWHWPCLAIAKYWMIEGMSWPMRLAMIIFSFVLAVFSWKYVESPFLAPRWKRTVPSRSVLLGVSLPLLGCIALAYAIRGANVPFWIPKDAIQLAMASKQYTNLQVSVDDARAGNFGPIGDRYHGAADFLLWGDSHAMSLLPCLEKLALEYRVQGLAATHSITAPLLDFTYFDDAGLDKETPVFANTVIDFVRQNGIKEVVIAGLWSAYFDASRDGTTNGEFAASLKKTIFELRSNGVRVSIMQEVPRQKTSQFPKLLARTRIMCGNVDAVGVRLTEHLARVRAVNDKIESLAGPDVDILDPSAFFFGEDGFCRIRKNDTCYFSDAQHLTAAGSFLLSDMFAPLFERIRRRHESDVRPDQIRQ